MTRQWIYRRCGGVHGPLGIDDLRAAAFLGFLQPGDLVRDLATDRWVEARSLEQLAATWPGRGAGEPAVTPTTGDERPRA